MVEKAGGGAAFGRFRLGRLVQQQGADLRAGGADLQSTLGLGGGGPRRAQGGRAALDISVPEGAEGSLRSDCTVLLGGVEFFEKHPGGEKFADLSRSALIGRT